MRVVFDGPVLRLVQARDILAHFDRPRTSNGLAEAMNRSLELLRSTILGFRSLTNYAARSLLEVEGGSVWNIMVNSAHTSTVRDC